MNGLPGRAARLGAWRNSPRRTRKETNGAAGNNPEALAPPGLAPAALGRTVECEVIPRLVVAHRPRFGDPPGAKPPLHDERAEAELIEFTGLLATHRVAEAMARIEARRAAGPVAGSAVRAMADSRRAAPVEPVGSGPVPLRGHRDRHAPPAAAAAGAEPGLRGRGRLPRARAQGDAAVGAGRAEHARRVHGHRVLPLRGLGLFPPRRLGGVARAADLAFAAARHPEHAVVRRDRRLRQLASRACRCCRRTWPRCAGSRATARSA